MMRAVHGSTVLYPSDANQAAALVVEMVDREGIVFLRTTREKTPVIYPAGERFPIGGSRVVRSSAADHLTLIGAGITLHESLKAADLLAAEGISARVIDLYSVKPIDGESLREAASATRRFVVAEDHWPEGGLGEAVLSVFADSVDQPRIVHLAVRHMPGSATPAQQLAEAGIDAAAIVTAARSLVAGESKVPAEIG
jgi:transketolase